TPTARSPSRPPATAPPSRLRSFAGRIAGGAAWPLPRAVRHVPSHSRTPSGASWSEPSARLARVLQLTRRVLRHRACYAAFHNPSFKEDERMGRFILGVIVGAAAVWFYGRDFIEYVDDKTRIARTKA